MKIIVAVVGEQLIIVHFNTPTVGLDKIVKVMIGYAGMGLDRFV